MPPWERAKRADISLRRIHSALGSKNGAAMVLSKVDHRSPTVRRLKELKQLQLADLGGADNISEAERILVQRASMLALQTELMEHRWLSLQNGEASPKQMQLYQSAVGALERTLRAVGLKRRPKIINPPTLEHYLKRKPKSEVVEAEEVEAAKEAAE
jgi:hypothetical protein